MYSSFLTWRTQSVSQLSQGFWPGPLGNCVDNTEASVSGTVPRDPVSNSSRELQTQVLKLNLSILKHKNIHLVPIIHQLLPLIIRKINAFFHN